MSRRVVLGVLGVVSVVTLFVASVAMVRQPVGCDAVAVSTPPSAPGVDELDDGQVAFAGHAWDIRSLDGAPTTVGAWGRGQVAVRDDGALILRQQLVDGQWRSAEVQTVERGFGHGTYRWTVESSLAALDPVVVLGLFTYERGAPGNREIDIEAAQWGDPQGDNMNFVSWTPDRLVRSWSNEHPGPTTHLFTWTPRRIIWCSQDLDGNVLAWSSRATAMEPGDERVHMNLWISRGTPPTRDTEIVISDFRFSPLTDASEG
jgi:hypothetical protein